ncbi:DUF1735 and LamG domain-containing protein [Proteiniphilum sp. X52]|uniref:DUF1735 and LamG domain-containing protein n=1 Tax=Proteiniphilum sp. X52 TaxID=2382159 RepID=UPI000F09E12A|nr:DUF1735 and LamG domain-containing protein [Proteiniphilum sp. X52]RNC64316.1 DUF1735 domain-containing protein [Proteiniphilum sp. X52]
MKHLYKIHFRALAAVFSFLLAACNDAEYPVGENSIFIEETGVKSNQRKVFTMEETMLNLEFTPRLSNTLSENVKIGVEMDTEFLKEFNQKNGTAYEAVPADGFELTANEFEIQAGKVVSSSSGIIKVKPFTQEMKDSGKKFALPIKITSKDGKTHVIHGADRIIYALDLVRYGSVPVFGVDNRIPGHRKAAANFKDYPLTLNKWSIEFRVKMDSYNINNQALFNCGGTGSEIYVRYGDAPIPYNQFQIKFGGSQVNSFMGEKNKWHHIAFTYDGTDLRIYLNGVLQSTLSNPGKEVKFDATTSICSSGSTYFRAEANMNELRIWNVARTEAEIKENFYAVAPDSEGLVSYWKMNEGQGVVLKNQIKGAPDMRALDANNNEVTTLSWIENVKMLND